MAILAIDVGGSHVKAAVVDRDGALQTEPVRIETPLGSPPREVVAAIAALVAPLPAAAQVAVGFPGMVRGGVVRTAPNLGHPGWRGFPLAAALAEALGRPVRLANDADVQGLAVIQGTGLELVVTLGTGFGTALYEDGHPCPHLEIAHLPFRRGETFDEQLGEQARRRVGTKKWRKRVARAVALLRTLTMFDRLYIGGGNARRLAHDQDPDVRIVDNVAGLLGGARLWRLPDKHTGFPIVAPRARRLRPARRARKEAGAAARPHAAGP